MMQKEYLDNESLSTIYFGGGTPSLLSPHDLEKLLTTIQKYFPLLSPVRWAEISMLHSAIQRVFPADAA